MAQRKGLRSENESAHERFPPVGEDGGAAAAMMYAQEDAARASREQSNIRPRSNPIAILSNNNNNRGRGDNNNSDNDDSSSVGTDFDLDGVATTAASMPARLLQAPRLCSVPYNKDYIISEPSISMLPPPMSSAADDNDDVPQQHAQDAGFLDNNNNNNNQVSYGSLRDSHLRGRFLDGPSSYRDRKSGSIYQMSDRLEFRRSNGNGNDSQHALQVVGSMPASLSIGERIMMGKKKHQSQQQASTTETSGLSAMLQSTSLKTTETTDHHKPPEEQQLFDTTSRQRVVAFSGVPAKQTGFTNADSNDMLSTSLTGLELMRRLSQERSSTGNKNSSRLSSSQDERHFQPRGDEPVDSSFPLALDSLYNHRSASDPSSLRTISLRGGPVAAKPFIQQIQTPQTDRSSLSSPASAFASDGSCSPPNDDTFLYGPVDDHGMLAGREGMLRHAYNTAASSSLPPLAGGISPRGTTGREYDPDTEGAFDMDLE